MMPKPDPTSDEELKKMAMKAMDASMETEVVTKVTLDRTIESRSKTVVRITFFKNRDNFAIDLYPFYKKEKNEMLLNLAFDLMKDKTKFENIREKAERC